MRLYISGEYDTLLAPGDIHCGQKIRGTWPPAVTKKLPGFPGFAAEVGVGGGVGGQSISSVQMHGHLASDRAYSAA